MAFRLMPTDTNFLKLNIFFCFANRREIETISIDRLLVPLDLVPSILLNDDIEINHNSEHDGDGVVENGH